MKKEEIKVVKVNAINAECNIWDSEIFLTAWTNGEGFELQISGKNGGIQHISITYTEFDIIKKCVKRLDSEPL